MFVCSSIIFAYFMRISHEYRRVEINIARAKAKYNALSGFALEAYENMFFRDFITDTLANGEPADSVQFYIGGTIEDTGIIEKMGNYDDVSVRIRKSSEGQIVRYGFAVGIAEYTSFMGKTLTLRDSMDITTKYIPSLNTFMYLTDNEFSGGGPQTMYNDDRTEVSFRDDDSFSGGENGDFQTNGTLVMNGPPNCPEFESTYTITQNSDGVYNDPDLNGCNFDQVFTGDPQTDTTGTVCLPPPSFDIKKQFADYIFDSTELLISEGETYSAGVSQRDTLIMTELEFLSDGGFRASRYKYLMPPHLSTSLIPQNIPANPGPADIDTKGYWGWECSTTNFSFETQGACNTSCGGTCSYTNDGNCPGSNMFNCHQYEQALNRYHAKTVNGLGGENYLDSDIREAHGTHSFDTHQFQYDPGQNSEFEPKSFSDNSTELTTDYYFPTGPVAIYIKGGPVLVHGTYKGRYTVITDEYITFRRHAYPHNNAEDTPIDTIYCNIWLVDDLINVDAIPSGSEMSLDHMQPTDKCVGGSENLIGLVSGANVIIANTRENGARSGTLGSLNINIHAHMIAFNESFIIHYWQNSTSYWNDWNVNGGTAYGNPTFKADGNGRRYSSSYPAYLDDDDDRGNIYLWGGFVQLYRGFMFRNYPGPYNITPGIGMDKHYRWDDNMRCNSLPLYPEKIECIDGDGPPQYDFEIAQFRIF
jgi:hypothetical protein